MPLRPVVTGIALNFGSDGPPAPFMLKFKLCKLGGYTYDDPRQAWRYRSLKMGVVTVLDVILDEKTGLSCLPAALMTA